MTEHTYRDSYRHRSANWTTWDSLHQVYAPGSKSAGERGIVSRIMRQAYGEGIPSFRSTTAPAHPYR